MQILNTVSSFRYIWIVWRITGINPPNFKKTSKRILYFIYALLLNILTIICYPLACVSLFFTTTDLKFLLRSMPYTISVINVSIKCITAFYVKKDLLKITKYLERLDSRASLHKDERKLLLKVTEISQKLFVTIAVEFSLCFIVLVIFSLYTKTFLIEQWFPFDHRTTYYYYAFIYQTSIACIVLIQDIASDTFPPCYIYVLLGHIKALNMRVTKIGKLQNNHYQELLACIRDHNDVLEVFKILQSIVGIVTFPQFCITASVFCMTAFKALILETDPGDRIVSYLFLIVIILQVYPCCYFGNDFIYESSKLTSAIFECDWLNQDMKFKKAMITFMLGSQMENYFIAGGLIRLRMATVGDILKFTFSLFIILASTKSLRL